MLALQTTTTVPPVVIEFVEATNWWTLGIPALAVVISVAAVVTTYLQGRAIRRIETREHEWEARDRTSAQIRVTRESYQYPTTIVPHGTTGNVPTFRNEWIIRLTNTGRAVATEVMWAEYDQTEETDTLNLFHSEITALAELHPGEHFDLPMSPRSNLGEKAVTFAVTWKDERGDHTTRRLINW